MSIRHACHVLRPPLSEIEHISFELNPQAGGCIYSALIQRRALAQSHSEDAILA